MLVVLFVVVLANFMSASSFRHNIQKPKWPTVYFFHSVFYSSNNFETGTWFLHVPKFLINLANEEKERKGGRERYEEKQF